MRLLLISSEYPPQTTAEANHAYYLGLHLARRGVEVHVLTSAIRGVKPTPGVRVHAAMPRWSWANLPRFRTLLRRRRPDGILLIFLGTMYSFQPLVTFAPTIAKTVLPSVRFVTQFENLGGVPRRRVARLMQRGAARIGGGLARVLSETGLAGTAPGGGSRNGAAGHSEPGLPAATPAASVWDRTLGLAHRCAGLLQADPEYGTLLRDSDGLIFLSDLHRIWAAAHQEQVNEKFSLIPPAPIMAFAPEDGAARARVRSALGARADDFLLVYYGHLYRSKGVETLLRALPAVVRSRPGVRLVVVGGALRRDFHSGRDPLDSAGYARRVQELSAKLGVADRVIWTGHCPGDSEQGSLYLRAADACVLPFDHGIRMHNSTFAAAAAHGLPVVTTRGRMLEEPLRDGENVLLCPPEDPAALATAIERLVDSPALCENLRAGARALAREWFSWERVVERTLAAFRLDPTT